MRAACTFAVEDRGHPVTPLRVSSEGRLPPCEREVVHRRLRTERQRRLRRNQADFEGGTTMKTLKVKFVCADTQERAVTAYHETGKELRLLLRAKKLNGRFIRRPRDTL